MNTTPEQRRELRKSIEPQMHYVKAQGKALAGVMVNPGTIIELLDDIERLESSRDMWKSALETFMAQTE